jgi:flagellar biogenesis protein FliO
MEESLSLLVEFVTAKQNVSTINFPVLIVIIGLLLAALWVCIRISKRNRLYINKTKKYKKLHTVKENEAA